MSDTIRIAHSVSLLLGIGTEYLLDANGDVVAKFQDGNMVPLTDEMPEPSDSETKS